MSQKQKNEKLLSQSQDDDQSLFLDARRAQDLIFWH